jgi:hypothetical protein
MVSLYFTLQLPQITCCILHQFTTFLDAFYDNLVQRGTFGPYSVLRNRSAIYAKVHSHLRYFGLCFTLKSARTAHCMHDFHAVIRAPFVIKK